MAYDGFHMTRQQPIAVLGGGSFGTAIANLLAENGHHVLLWMRDAEQAESIRRLRQNPRYLKGVEILVQVEPTTDLSSTLDACELSSLRCRPARCARRCSRSPRSLAARCWSVQPRASRLTDSC